MGTNYPTSADTFPSAATLAAHTLATDPHSTLHGNLGDAVAAVQTAIGFTGAFAFVKTGDSPTWTGTHTFSLATTFFGAAAVPATLQQVAPASGAGNSLTIAASAAASGNTNGGDVLLKPGAKAGGGADGFVIIRQPGGVAGTDEFRLYHDGTRAFCDVKDGGFRVRATNGVEYFSVYDLSGNLMLVLTSGNDLFCRGAVNTNSTDGAISTGTMTNGIFTGKSTGAFQLSSGANTSGANDVSLYRATVGVWGLGASTNTGRSTLASAPLLVNLGTDQTDYAPGVFRTLRINATASFNLNSLVAGVDGEERYIHNAAAVGSGFNVTIKHATGATATNQFSLPAGADIVLAPQQTQGIWYDGTSTRWKVQ